jgi:hypothetical protein
MKEYIYKIPKVLERGKPHLSNDIMKVDMLPVGLCAVKKPYGLLRGGGGIAQLTLLVSFKISLR